MQLQLFNRDIELWTLNWRLLVRTCIVHTVQWCTLHLHSLDLPSMMHQSLLVKIFSSFLLVPQRRPWPFDSYITSSCDVTSPLPRYWGCIKAVNNVLNWISTTRTDWYTNKTGRDPGGDRQESSWHREVVNALSEWLCGKWNDNM